MILSLRGLLSSFAVLATLTGCGSFANHTSPAKIAPDAFTSTTSGVVVLSTGAPDHCMNQATYMLVMDAQTHKAVDSAPLLFVDFYTNKSEFADHHGLVSAVALKAGDYYLSPAVANPMVKMTKKPAFDFHVNAGETVYIGELFMPVACNVKEVFLVNDRFDRDVPMASAANPAIAAHPPIKRLMQGRQQ